jgi:hypothetical protein
MGESGVLDERALSEAKLNEIYAPLRQAVSASVARQEELVGKIQVCKFALHHFFGNM